MRFGTDGVRGLANVELTPELALIIGRAAARVLGGTRFLIGRDPRHSGPMLEAALAAGIAAEGVDVELLGILPTPAVACLSALDGVPSAVISASHNPAADNGIKLFSSGGLKLGDEAQSRLEAEMDAIAAGQVGTPTGADLGVISHTEHESMRRYEDSAVAALDGRRLDGLRVVLDCANGASSEVAPDVFRRLGADVAVIHAAPDGLNINDGCGSTHPEDLTDAVLDGGAQLGFAFDGDADRVLAVDAAGRLIDGDQLIALSAVDLHRRGRLKGDAVVVTVMTNLGFRQGMAAAGIGVVETAVGDRHVLEALDRGGYSLGGEQSGHLIFRDVATTGDGLLSALLVADAVVRSGRGLGELADAAMTRLPQVLRNVRLVSRPADLLERVGPAVAGAEAALGTRGRVLLRPSGTEPVVRVMVEAPELVEAERWAEELAQAVTAAAESAAADDSRSA
jgi:phosphoglucosamine mutase